MLIDPIDAYITALRPWLERFRANFEAGDLTGFESDAKYEKDAGWMFDVKPVINTKVHRAWARR